MPTPSIAKTFARLWPDLPERAGLLDLDSFAHFWHLLMKGSIVAAAEADAGSAPRVKSMERLMIIAGSGLPPSLLTERSARSHPSVARNDSHCQWLLEAAPGAVNSNRRRTAPLTAYLAQNALREATGGAGCSSWWPEGRRRSRSSALR